MKKILAYIILFVEIVDLIKDNICNGLFLLLFINIPIIILTILNKLNKNINYGQELNNLFYAYSNLVILLFCVNILSNTLYNAGKFDGFSPYIIYIEIIIFEVMYINYFSTSNSSLKLKISTLIKSINSFFSESFLINLLVFLLLLFIKQISNNIFLAIISSYIFYILTEISQLYKKEKSNIKLDTFDYILLVIINYLMIFFLSDFEFLINSLEHININLNIFFHLFILGLFSLISILKIKILAFKEKLMIKVKK